MKNRIEFNIFHYTDSTKTLNDLGLPYPLSDSTVLPMTFYHINLIGIYKDTDDDDREYCEIHSNGSNFIVADLTYDEVKEKLANF